MRPKIAMWSDYGAPRHKHWRTPSRRSSRSSIGPKILAAAVVVNEKHQHAQEEPMPCSFPHALKKSYEPVRVPLLCRDQQEDR
jgi:hypothetical protein